jgi:hypothetical protein
MEKKFSWNRLLLFCASLKEMHLYFTSPYFCRTDPWFELLTLFWRALFEYLIGVSVLLVKKVLPFTELRSSSPCSQNPYFGPYPERVKSGPYSHSLFKTRFNIILPSTLNPPNCLFPFASFEISSVGVVFSPFRHPHPPSFDNSNDIR